MGYELKFSVWRGDSTSGELQDYTVEVSEGEVVLDVLHRIQATQARRPRGALELQGRQVRLVQHRDQRQAAAAVHDAHLGLRARRDDHRSRRCATFPVIRDLVTDVSCNYEKAKALPLVHAAAARRRRQAPHGAGRRRAGQEFRKCIECFLCQNVCHVVRDHEENKPAFAGPRFFLRYAELDMHPLDTHDRRELAQGAAGLGMCNITKCCTEVCPEGINITDNAIIPMKERVVDRKYDPLVWLGNKIGMRNKDNDGRSEV